VSDAACSPSALASALVAAGCSGPVLVAAVDAAIARAAPAWADSFAQAGWTHRVLAVVATDPGLEAAIAAEARSLRARCIVAWGPEPVPTAARRAAAAAGVPCVAVAPVD